MLRIDTLPGMRSVYEQRRHNLRELIRTWGGPTSLAKKLGHSNGSYLAQLAGPHPSRDLSEKTAREVEAKLGLPLGWLDSEHQGSQQMDDQALAQCVRAVAAALRDAGRKTDPEVMGGLVSLVYDHARLTGVVSEPYIKKLMELMR